MNAKERINAILQYYEINAKVFAERIGMDRPQAIYDIINEKTKTITDKMANKIISVFSDINKSWLLTGEGEMIKDAAFAEADILEDKHKAPLQRILQLLSEEGISLADFTRCVHSSESRFGRALSWPKSSSNKLLGNDSQIRDWIDSFCELFPHYSKMWILFGIGDRYSFVARNIHEINQRISELEVQQKEDKKTLLGILNHLITEKY